MVKDLSQEPKKPRAVTYSYYRLGGDILILLLAILPEAVQRIALLFTDKPIVPFLQERGYSVTWLLVITVPVAIIIFFRAHRTKITDEMVFVFRQAPLLVFVFGLTVSLLILKGCDLADQKAQLAGKLEQAIYPPAYFGDTNQLVLEERDYNRLLNSSKAFAKTFTKTNQQPPIVTLLLYASSQNSRHLLRQLKDAVDDSGWDVKFDKSTLVVPIDKGIIIYCLDASHPCSQAIFWQKYFEKISMQCAIGYWSRQSEAQIGSEGCVLAINDPDYLK